MTMCDKQEAIKKALMQARSALLTEASVDDLGRFFGGTVAALEDIDAALASLTPAPVASEGGELGSFRIVEAADGFEPQMLHTSARGPERVWYPLLATGYWAEPEAYSYGVVTKRNPLPTRADAERAIERAKSVNAERPIVAPASDNNENK